MDAENTYKIIIQTPTSWKLPKHSRLGPIKKVYGLVYEKVTNLISTGSFPLEIPKVCLDSGNGELHVLAIWFFHDYITVSSLKTAILNELKHNRPVLDSSIVLDILKRSIGTIYIPASSLSKSIKSIKNSRSGTTPENLYNVFERRSILKFRIAIEPEFIPLSAINDLEEFFQKSYHKKQIGINRAGFHIFDVNDTVGPSNLSFIQSQSTSERNFSSRSYRSNDQTPDFYSKMSPTHSEYSSVNVFNKDLQFHNSYGTPDYRRILSVNIPNTYTTKVVNRKDTVPSNNVYYDNNINYYPQSNAPAFLSNTYYPKKDNVLHDKQMQTPKDSNDEYDKLSNKYKCLLGSYLSLAFSHHKQNKLYQSCNAQKERYVAANLANMLKFLNQKRKLQASREASKRLAKQLLLEKAKNTKLTLKLASMTNQPDPPVKNDYFAEYNNLKEVNELLTRQNALLIEQNGEVKNILSMTNEKHEIQIEMLKNQIKKLEEDVDTQNKLIDNYKQEMSNYNQAVAMLKDEADHQETLIEQYKRDLAKYKSDDQKGVNRTITVKYTDELKKVKSINDDLNEQLKSISARNADLKNQNAVLNLRIKQLESSNTNQIEKKLDQIADFISRNLKNDSYHVVKDRISESLSRFSHISKCPEAKNQNELNHNFSKLVTKLPNNNVNAQGYHPHVIYHKHEDFSKPQKQPSYEYKLTMKDPSLHSHVPKDYVMHKDSSTKLVNPRYLL